MVPGEPQAVADAHHADPGRRETFVERLLLARVQRAGRFIEERIAGPIEQQASEGDLLLLAQRELVLPFRRRRQPADAFGQSLEADEFQKPEQTLVGRVSLARLTQLLPE